MVNPIKTPQEMMYEQAGIPHMSIGGSTLTAGAKMLMEQAVKRFKSLTGRHPNAEELAQIEQHAAGFSKPTAEPSMSTAEAKWRAKDPNYLNPDDTRDPLVIKQMTGRTKSGTKNPVKTEDVHANPVVEADTPLAAQEVTESSLSKSEVPSIADEGAHPGMMADDTPVSESTFKPSTTPSADYFANTSQAIENAAMNEKYPTTSKTVYDVLQEKFFKEHGRRPTPDEWEVIVAEYNPGRTNYRGGEITGYTSGAGYDPLISRPGTARGLDAWRQTGRDFGIKENYLVKNPEKYTDEMKNALELLREHKKNGGQITPTQMAHEMLVHGRSPQKFAKGNSVVQEDTVYDPMGNVVYSSYLGEPVSGKTKTAAKVLHNIAAVPATIGPGAISTMSGIGQILGFDEPAKAAKSMTEGIAQRAPVGAKIGETIGSIIDPVTLKLLGLDGGVGKQALYGAAQGYMMPVHGEDTGFASPERGVNAATTAGLNALLTKLGKYLNK